MYYHELSENEEIFLKSLIDIYQNQNSWEFIIYISDIKVNEIVRKSCIKKGYIKIKDDEYIATGRLIEYSREKGLF